MNTEIITIVDASESMAPLRLETVAGYNNFINQQCEQPGDVKASLVMFNNRLTPMYSGAPLRAVAKLWPQDYNCKGATALYDAVGSTLEREGARIARERWAELVIVCVITDGQENMSHRYSREQVAELTGKAQCYGWKFVYLAANVDAWATGRDLGIDPTAVGNSVGSFRHTGAGATASYAAYGAHTTSLRSGKL